MTTLSHPVHRRAAGVTAAARRKPLPRKRLAVTGLALATLMLFVLAMCLGDYPVTPIGVAQSLLSPLTGVAQPGTDFIVLGVRLPRATMAVVTGIAFGLSGTIFQTLLRNPLASPDIIGISTGASAAAVTGIVLFGLSGAAISGFALAGGVATALAIYLLAWRDGLGPYRIVLIGIAMAAILTAVISYMFTRARLTTVQKALTWLTGSLNSVSADQLLPPVLALCVLVPAALVMLRPLKNLQLSDDVARSLGTRPELAYPALIAIAAALVAFATAAVGPVTFVAFLAGPIGRRLAGTGDPAFAASALSGAAIMLGADTIAQHFLGNSQLPVGVVTGGFGAVFLIWLLVLSNRAGRVQ